VITKNESSDPGKVVVKAVHYVEIFGWIRGVERNNKAKVGQERKRMCQMLAHLGIHESLSYNIILATRNVQFYCFSRHSIFSNIKLL